MKKLTGIISLICGLAFASDARSVNSTELSPNYCGGTLSTMTQEISCVAVIGAQNYKYVFTNVGGVAFSQTVWRGDTTNDFNMTWVTGLLYGATYAVTVAVETAGVWGSLGSACNLTTPAPPEALGTQLTPSICGNTVTMTQEISCVADPNAQNYKYLFTNIGGVAFSQTIYRGDKTNDFNMAWVTGLAYGAPYAVSVAEEVNGVWGAFGSSCPIVTAASASTTTGLTAADCNTVISSPSTPFYCTAVAGALNYKWLMTCASPVYNQTQWAGSTATDCYLSWYSGLTPGAVYNVQVSANIGGTWTPWGPTCTITNNTGLRLRNPLNNTSGESTSEISMYPNPVAINSALTIDLGNMLNNQVAGQLKVIDILGSEIISKQISGSSLINLTMDEHFKPGMYFVEVTAGGQKQSTRIVVQ